MMRFLMFVTEKSLIVSAFDGPGKLFVIVNPVLSIIFSNVILTLMSIESDGDLRSSSLFL